MNFDTVTTNPCIPGTGPGSNGTGSNPGGPTDPRCLDAAFAAAHPDICGQQAYLVIKPSSSIITVLGSVQFEVFLYQNGVENLLSSGLLFGSSDTSIFVVGASSGNGTGLKPGVITVTATYQGMDATAGVTVVDSTVGCSQTIVATAVVVDNSLSMSQSFGGAYRTLLDAAKAFGVAYAGNILQVNGHPKDSLTVFNFNDIPNQITTGFISDTNLLTQQINGIAQSQGDTDLSSAIKAAIAALQATTASELVLVLLTDGQQTDAPTEQDVLNAAYAFTSAGGIIICVGIRANGSGFDLLERAATGGFFINVLSSNVAASLSGLSYLKSVVCAGSCIPAGDFYEAAGTFDYSSFKNWSVIGGETNLLGNGFLDLLPGNGLYVELAEDNHPATLQSIAKFTLNPGDTYEISFSLAGNNETFTPSAGQSVKVYVQDVNSGINLFEHVVAPDWNAPFQTYDFNFTATYAATVRIYFQQLITPGYTGNFAGNLLDNIVFKDVTTLVFLLEDNFDDENIVYVPPACGPNAALPAIADPTQPGLLFINYFGGSQIGSETYKYAISYKTQQGETNLSPVASTATLPPVSMPHQAILLSGILPNPTTDPQTRVISIRIWRNDSSASNTLYLLAEISPENINYVDLLNHAQFAAVVNTGIIPPASNTTAVAAGALGFGVYGCYEPPCDPGEPTGPQSSDPNPLPNIESPGTGGGTLYTSTQQVCQSCPSGSLPTVNNVYSTPSSDGSVIDFGVPTPGIGVAVALNYIPPPPQAGVLVFSFFGSNDGINWNQINLTINVGGTNPPGGTVSGNTSTSLPGNTNVGGSFNFCAQYRYYKITYDKTKWILPAPPNYEVVTLTNNQICKSATATSYVSQQDADAKAVAAATQQVQQALAQQCVNTWSSTKSFTANCPCGRSGQPVTKTATYLSCISQADADTNALALAQAAAQAALNCTQSNNAQAITIQDGPNAPQPASIYPSVKYVTGGPASITKVTVSLKGLKHQNFSDIGLLLVSPSGRTCLLLCNCMAGAPFISQFGGGISPHDVTIDDTGVTLPQNGPLDWTNPNNFKWKPTQYGAQYALGGCAPGLAYGTALSVFAGDNSNGAWSLYCVDSTFNNFSGAIGGGFDLVIT